MELVPIRLYLALLQPLHRLVGEVLVSSSTLGLLGHPFQALSAFLKGFQANSWLWATSEQLPFFQRIPALFTLKMSSYDDQNNENIYNLVQQEEVIAPKAPR